MNRPVLATIASILSLAAMPEGALAKSAATPAKSAAAPASVAKVVTSGRTVTITLPYRTKDNLLWVSASRVMEMAPFMFRALDIKPNAGPGGTDLAIFTYVADRAGSTTLKFGLVPPGKMLIGPPMMVYHGPVARREAIHVAVK